MNNQEKHGEKIWRITSAILMSLVFLFFILILARVFQLDVLVEKNGGKHLKTVAVVLSPLMFISGFMAWRFWQGSVSTNGKTNLPSWFLWLLGIIFLSLLGLIGYFNPKLLPPILIPYGYIAYYFYKNSKGNDHKTDNS